MGVNVAPAGPACRAWYIYLIIYFVVACHMEDKSCTFSELDEMLQRAGADSGAAEAHGVLCGALAVRGVSTDGDWLEHLLGDGNTLSVAAQDCIETLQAMQAGIICQFNDASFGFSMLLPEDNSPLSTRTRALGEWCSGFLYGLALGGVREGQAGSEHADEIMKDFYEISHAGFGTEAPGEADEAAYAEIVEYIRVSVLMLHDELNTMPASPQLH